MEGGLPQRAFLAAFIACARPRSHSGRGRIFLILELNEPHNGLFKIPRGAMEQAIEALR
jgi:hypothetical protein